MNQSQLVSVVIPTFNRERTLSRAIDSVINQTYQNWELIIVDDRSSDNTSKLVQEYMQKDKRIKYIKNTFTKGPAGARNKGVKESKGEFIAFLDSDDEWLDIHLLEIMDEFEKNPDIDWIYSDAKKVDGKKIIYNSSFNEAWKGKDKWKTEKREDLFVLDKKDALTSALEYSTYAGLQVSVIRRKVFSTMKFDETIFCVEDQLTPLEAIASGFRLAYLNKVHVIIHSENDAISIKTNAESNEKKIEIYLELEKLYKKIPRIIPLKKNQRRIINYKLLDLYSYRLIPLFIKGNKKRVIIYCLKMIKLEPVNFSSWKALKNLLVK